jgi:hypothetical protein
MHSSTSSPSPSFSTAYGGGPTLGGRIEKTARHLLGVELMPWQSEVARTIWETDDAGMFKRRTVILQVPRQCGKSTLLAASTLARATTGPGVRVYVTAQTGKDARERFQDTKNMLLRSPLKPVPRKVIRPYEAAGMERFEFPELRSFIRVFSPQEDAIHGNAADMVCFDEAWAFDTQRGRALEQAAAPAFSTRYTAGHAPGPQLWIISTAGDDRSTWFKEWVDLGRASVSDPSSPVAFFEWSASEDDDVDDEDMWARVHPGLGHTITLEAMRHARSILGPDGFGRAYLNRWTRVSESVIPLTAWASCLDRASVAAAPAAIALDVSFDRSHASIAAASPRPDGRFHVEVIEDRDGTDWIAGRCYELARRYRVPIHVDTGGPAGSVVPALQRARVPLANVRMAGHAAACGDFYDSVIQGSVVHIGQNELDAALACAVRRPLADAWAWGRAKASGDISPLVAVTLALAGAKTPAPRMTVVAM